MTFHAMEPEAVRLSRLAKAKRERQRAAARPVEAKPIGPRSAEAVVPVRDPADRARQRDARRAKQAAEALGFPLRGGNIPGIDAAGRAFIIDKIDDGRLRWRFAWRWRALVSQVSLERRALKLAVRARPDVAQATVRKAFDALAEALKAAKLADGRARLWARAGRNGRQRGA